jgi:predicted secreted acid phosphatase
MRYSIIDTARAAGAQDAEMLEFLRAFWFARFFKNDYLAEDEPVPGAAEFCAEALARGAALVYLTGRDEGMRVGTLSALARHGFPAPDGLSVVLSLKPSFETPDFEFKAEALKAVAKLGAVAGGFENEPSHVNLMAEAFPGSTMVLVETRHSGKPVSPLPAVSRIKDFRRR